MTSKFALAGMVLVFGATAAFAQGRFPTTGSMAGVTIISPGRSIKPEDITPTEPYRPRPFPPAWERNNSIPGAAITVGGR